MDEYLRKLKQKKDEVDNSPSKNKDTSSLEQLIKILEEILDRREHNSELLKELLDQNQEYISSDERRIIQFLSAMICVGDVNINGFDLSITDDQATALNNIINKLTDVIENSQAPIYMENLYIALTTNPLDVNLDDLDRSFDDLEISTEIKCKILLELLVYTSKKAKGEYYDIEPNFTKNGESTRILTNN